MHKRWARKTVVGVALCSVTLLGVGSSAAFAGEVTGSGKGGPVGDGQPGGPTRANSICTFSGLADGGEGEPAGPGNPPQSWGQIPQDVRDFLRTIGEYPGMACNGHLNPLKP